ncbi:recombinase family protein [Novosphingobium beihaiensis]|uniref:Recombinase family protein n=1 Tax=Novosphingobium beihaiensis TaxID=2930389 RepID=A0ABT0BS52_9SPHN|nr:recombinase family protein [Novosphingobium beihaiensis]MCJ2187887.1 recombinase family protein [Novosphingobium beihaiensis]
MIGYARVSKIDQNLDLQLDALRAEGCEAIYADHGVSGAKRKRPEFDKALNALRAGDTLVVWKLDRMSRSLRDLLDIVEEIHGRDAHFKCITDQIDTTNPMGEFFFHILASLAHFERRLISERTKAGLEAARKRGVRLGRPPRDRWIRERRCNRQVQKRVSRGHGSKRTAEGTVA